MEPEPRSRIWNLLVDEASSAGGVSIDLVCSTAVRVLAVDGAAITLIATETAREVAGATGDPSRRLEELQFMLGEGPGLDCFAAGEPVLAADLLGTAARWPVFAPAAIELGVGSVFSFPLQFGAIAVGTLEVHRSAAEPLTGTQLGDALVLADTAALLLLEAHGRDVPSEPVPSCVKLAQDYHTEVYQATGMLSVQLRTGLDEALARLRGYAFANEVPISTVAREILAGHLKFDEGDADA